MFFYIERKLKINDLRAPLIEIDTVINLLFCDSLVSQLIQPLLLSLYST